MGGERDNARRAAQDSRRADAVERRIAALAARQHGVATRAQLRALGLGDGAIDLRVRRARLIRLHRGVYAVGHAQLRPQGHWLAAVLACGESAVLSHATALAAWGLRETSAARVDVTVPTTAGVRRRRDVRCFRHRDLRSAEVTVHDRVPITSVPRTLLDAATILEPHALRRAVEAAFRMHGVTVGVLREVVDAHPGRAGTPALAALADDFEAYGVTFSRSDLESMMLELCAAAGLPRPLVNHRHGGREIDCRWPEHGLVVELDGYETHRGRAQFVADRARNRQHVLRGETIVAYTYHDVRDQPVRVANELRQLLARLAPDRGGA